TEPQRHPQHQCGQAEHGGPLEFHSAEGAGQVREERAAQRISVRFPTRQRGATFGGSRDQIEWECDEEGGQHGQRRPLGDALQPLVLTEDRLWNCETRFRGEETMDDADCWVLEVRPRQILTGQRYFDGLLWIDKKAYNIVRMEGRAVPEIRTTKTENLFPRFT